MIKPPTLASADVVARRYIVVRELGRGGMAAVYLCHDRVTGEDVALKVLFFDQPQAMRKNAIWFFQEARALAALDHPVIVRARDFGTLPEGAPYLVMDAIDGKTLHAWKHYGPLPWEVTWTIVDQVLAGLAHAHARGIVHGDLKPSNVMLDPSMGEEPLRVYVLDLGLAWLLADNVDPRLHMFALDAPAMPLGGGTAGWLAPEQIRRATPHIGPATDLYALGCVLYELLAGREVFVGTTQEVVRAHRDLPPPPPTLLPGIPKGASDFVVKLLAKRPWHRYRFAADARAAWAELGPKEPVFWVPPVPSSSSGERSSSPSPRPSSHPSKRPIVSARHLAPGIIALRPCPLVGRDDERAELDAIVDETLAAKDHRLVVLEGEAGVGKSRLAEWLCETVHETARMVPLRAKYRRIASPLDGLRGAFLAHYNLVGQPREIIEQALLNEWEVKRSDEDGRTWVAAAAAWLRPAAPDEPLDVGPTRKRFVLDKPEIVRSIVRHVLERVAGGRAVCIWLDDLHLSPKATYEGLEHLHVDAAAVPMLLVATTRTEDLAVDAEAQRRIGVLSHVFRTNRFTVAPLDEPHTRRLLQATLPLTDEAEAIAIARSQGNPLYALQLVHAWASGQHLTLKGGLYEVTGEGLGGAAATTTGLWDERLANVEEPFRLAAFAAAALGVDIPLEALAYLFESLGYDVEEAIYTLRRAQVLFLEPGERFRFPHSLLHEHVFGKLLESPEAAHVFRLTAEALAFHPDAGTERIVRHRAQCLLYAGEGERAADIVLAYVAAAFPQGRDANAARAALAILDGHVTGKRRALSLRWRAEVERRAGSSLDARRLAEEAEAELLSVGDKENAALCTRLLAQIACDEGSPSMGRALIAQAIHVLEKGSNEAALAEAETTAGRIEHLLGDHEAAIEKLAHAATRFRRLGDAIGGANCLLYQALSELAAGRTTLAKDLLLSARAVFEDRGHAHGLGAVDVGLAKVAHRAHRYAEAREKTKETRGRFEALANVPGMIACARLAAMAALDDGDPKCARTHAQEALALTASPNFDPWGQAEANLLLAQSALAEGNRAAGRAHLAAAEAARIDDGEARQHLDLTTAWLALVEGAAGRAIVAIERARAAFPDPRRTGDHAPQLVARLLELARGTDAEAALATWNGLLLTRPSRPPPRLVTDEAAAPVGE